MQLPFIGQTYNSRSNRFDASRSINFFPELTTEANSKNVMCMVGTPGTKLFSIAKYPPVRGLYSFNGLLFVVASNQLYSMNANGVLTNSLGTLNTYDGRVCIKDNGLSQNGPTGGNQLIIVDGVDMYVYNVVTNAFTVVSHSVLPVNVNQIAYIDSYIVAVNNTMNAYSSNAHDATTWQGTAMAAIFSSSDPISGVTASSEQIYFIKQNTTEVWANNATDPSLGFPFSRVSGAVIDYGTLAPWSIARGSGVTFFLAWQKVEEHSEFVGVAAMSGYSVSIISTPAINYRIAQSTQHSQCFAYCYSEEGHSFYVLTNPIDNWTFVFDSVTQLWHERSSYIGTNVPYTVGRHLSNCYTMFNDKHYVGDYLTGNIYEMSQKYYSEDGKPIISTRTCQPIYDKDDYERKTIKRLIVDMETGVGDLGLYSQTGLKPNAVLSWSKDNGNTWSGEYASSLGAIGQYSLKLSWRRLGISRDKIFKLTISDSVKKILINAFIK